MSACSADLGAKHRRRDGDEQSYESACVLDHGRRIYKRLELRVSTACYGNAYATYASPDFVPNLPPPAAITTYCFPRTANVLGVA